MKIHNIKQIHHVIGWTAKPCDFFLKEGGEKETNPLLKQDAWHLADTEQYLHSGHYLYLHSGHRDS